MPAPSPAPTTPAPQGRPAGLYDIPDDEPTTSFSPNDDACDVFVDRDGDFVAVMCCDYGFRSGVARMYQGDDGKVPGSAWQMSIANFREEFKGARQCFRYNEFADIAAVSPIPDDNWAGRAAYAVGGAVVWLFAAIDTALEKVGILGPVERRAPTTITQTQPAPQQAGTDFFAADCSVIRQRLSQLKLSNTAVWNRELAREAKGAGVDTPWPMRVIYLALCLFLDLSFRNRPIQRFWVLETVARMPYFSYISLLHLYESLGWWRAGAELRKVHFAEEWNELHHLQIMETLGGDQLWIDRFLAQHAAIVYYWLLLALYFFSPRLAYLFSELIEAHAVDTYGEFCDANEAILKELPPPRVAAEYYRSEDLYMFDDFQTNINMSSPRRPPCRNLLDVFRNICDDEFEHTRTMRACQRDNVHEVVHLRGQ